MAKNMSNNDIVAYEGGDYGEIMDNYDLHEITAAIANRAGKAADTVRSLEQEVEEMKNNPDVVDIVATYADLQAYDTQHLTDKDIIRVLQDETHDGESTYYRYSKQSNTWTYIGESKQYGNFVGTDGTAAGAAGLVPAPATTDAGKFLKADGTWDDAAGSTYTAGDGIDITNDVISATNTGKAKELTSSDYNYPITGTKTSVALWLLDPGLYTWQNSVKVSAHTGFLDLGNYGYNGAIVTANNSSYDRKTIFAFGPLTNTHSIYGVNSSGLNTTGTVILLSSLDTIDDLTNTSTTKPLSAKQGKVLKDLIDSIAIQNAGAPTTATVGTVGQLLEDTTNGKLYQCTAIDNTDPQNIVYTWTEVGAGGSGPTVVQTTGTSQTDVMSQNAVTGMVFADPSTRRRVEISNSTRNTGNYSVAIGSYATAAPTYSVAVGDSAQCNNSYAVAFGEYAVANGIGGIALGARSYSTNAGEMNIGTDTTTYGYNNSNYRLISGVYDGQSAHDAATKGQLDGIVLTNAGAPTTATVGTVGQLLEDTTNGKLYICTAVTPGTDPDPDTYTWTEVGAGGSGPTVVQTTGTSTTDVMSQNAVTEMVFADPATKSRVRIGAYTSAQGDDTITIGAHAFTAYHSSTAIGNYASTYGANNVSIGRETECYGTSNICLGPWAKTSSSDTGVMQIGSNRTGYETLGYNNSQYRLLTGLYDPQGAHDAATKGYVDPTSDSSAPTTATVGRLGQIQIDTSNNDAYMCVAVDSVTPAYTWKKITA